MGTNNMLDTQSIYSVSWHCKNSAVIQLRHCAIQSTGTVDISTRRKYNLKTDRNDVIPLHTRKCNILFTAYQQMRRNGNFENDITTINITKITQL